MAYVHWPAQHISPISIQDIVSWGLGAKHFSYTVTAAQWTKLCDINLDIKWRLCLSLHIKKAYCIQTQIHTYIIIQCLIKKTLFLLSMAGTTRRVWTARGSTRRPDNSRMGQRCWTASCRSSFQTVRSPPRWDLEWSKVWPAMGRSPSSPQWCAKRARGTFRWRAGSRPQATERKVPTSAWGAPRERRAAGGTELGPSPPGTSVDEEGDGITNRTFQAPIIGKWKRLDKKKAYLCIFIPPNNFIQCLLYIPD